MKLINLVRELIAPYHKFVAVYLTGIVFFLLGFVGIVKEMTVEEAVAFAVAGLMVYLAPKNKTK